MPVEKVNGKMNVSFGESVNVQPVKNKKTPEQIKDGKKKLALALGALAVAGAVTAGFVIGIKKGKLDTLKMQTKLSVEDFKKIGNFDKGKALINGKGYTGEIFTKDGTKMLYNDGLILSSQNHNPQKLTNFAKSYTYLENGNKIISTTKGIAPSTSKRIITPDHSVIIDSNFSRDHNGFLLDRSLRTGKTGVVLETKFKPIITDGKKSAQKIETIYLKNPKFKNGESIYYKRIKDLSTGKVSLERINKPVQKSQIKVPVKLADGRKGKALYSGKELVYQEVGSYDPATKTVITEYLEPNNPNSRSLFIFDKSNKDWPALINIDKRANKAYATNYGPAGFSQLPVSNEGDLKDLVQWSQNWIDALKNFMKKYN